MVEAVRVYARYEIEDSETGETRREKNERLNVETPVLDIPLHGKYIWDWYTSINFRTSRIRDSVCFLIPLVEYVSWAKLTGNIVYSWEYDILMDMDQSFCSETNKEFRSRQEKEREKQESESKSRRKR